MRIQAQKLTTVRYVGNIVKMGQKRFMIEIPVKFHNDIKPLLNKQIKVTLEEAIQEEKEK